MNEPKNVPLNLNTIMQGDALSVLKTFPDECVDCCVTSPPYWGLRDYGTGKWVGGDENCKHRRETKNANPDWEIQSRGKVDNGVGDEIMKDECRICGAKRVDAQLGLEKTPEEYVQNMVSIFTEVKRILKNDGTLWLNLGDSYNGYPANVTRGGKLSGSNQHARHLKESGYGLAAKELKPKDLVGIPWMVAFALRSSGWYLRQDIIWHKPNPMPESVTDRCTKSHEYIFLLSKSTKYYYDAYAIKTEIKDTTVQRMGRGVSADHKNINGAPGKPPHTMNSPRLNIKAYDHRGTGDKKLTGHSGNFDRNGNLIGDGMANKKSVWTVTTKPFSEAHFATFPEDLIVDCIKAGCPEGGIVLDPFMGAGTTALVARKFNRNFIGIELNPEYIKIAEKRLKKELGMFL